MRRDTHFPVSMVRDTLEYAEARMLFTQQAELKKFHQDLKIVLRTLRHLSPKAVLLAAQDLGEQDDDGV
jgi:hypothetical protein